MNSVELVKQAATQNVHGPRAVHKYLQMISKKIGSTKMEDICDEVCKQHAQFSANKTRFNGLSLFLNLEVEKMK